MTTEIDYPGCTLNITSGANEVILSPTSVVSLNASNSATLAPASLTISNPDATQLMVFAEENIQYNGTAGAFSVDVGGFIGQDASGNSNGVYNGVLNTAKTDGSYLSLGLDAGLNINGNYGSAGQILQKDGANAMTWGAPLFCPLATEALDMNNFAISNVSAVNAPVAGTSMNGQMTFDTPPHVPDPILGNDAASKGYVDTLVGNYSGNGLTLYFNYGTTQTDPIIAPSVGVLGQTLAPIDSPTTDNFYRMTSVAPGTDTLISTFTSAVGFPNTLTIPAGLWSMLIWGWATSPNGQLYYHFHLNEVTSAGVFVAQIGTSGFSSDVNATSAGDPDAYHCSLAIVDGYTMASINNRLQVQIYTTGTSPTSAVLNTLFGGDYYSNIVTTLSAGASLLTQNNTWTGVQSFSAGFNTTAVDSATTLGLGTATSTATTLGRVGAPTTINAQNLTLYAGGAGSSGQILTKGATYATWVDPAFVGTANQLLNMGIYDISGTKMDSSSTLSLGTATATDTYLGRAGATTANVTATTINLVGAVKSTAIDSATTLSLGTGTATTTTLGRTANTATNINGNAISITGATSVGLSATTINLTGAVKSTAIDSATTLSLGTVTATDTYLGRTGATTANVTAATVNLVGNVKASAIDRSSAGTLNIGLATATDVVIGRTGLPTAVIRADDITLSGTVQSGNLTATSFKSGSLDAPIVNSLSIGPSNANSIVIGRVGLPTVSITANAISLNAPVTGVANMSVSSLTTESVDRASPATLSIGPTNATNIAIGRAGLANASITATAIALTGAVTGPTTLSASTSVACPSLICPAATSSATSDTISYMVDNISGVASLFTAATRTANLNIQNGSSNNNTINIGSANTTTNFGGSIRGLSSTLGVLTPVVPSMTYTATGLGAISTSAVGSVIADPPASVAILTTATNIANVAIPCAGVWLISGTVTFRNTSGVAGTNDRVQIYLNYGANLGTGQNILQYTIGKLQLGETGPLGFQSDFSFSYVYTVTTAAFVSGNYITMSAQNNGTTTLALTAQTKSNNGSTILQVVRIA